MFRIGSMFEGGKSDIPRGCMYAVDINGAVKLEANCRNATMIAVAIAILSRLNDADFKDFVEGWNDFVESNRIDCRCLAQEDVEALRKENKALRTENANLRFALSEIKKEEK